MCGVNCHSGYGLLLLCSLQALREELQALYDAANKGWVELIKHCYSKHPPLNPANR
jgi:hypothetical protein